MPLSFEGLGKPERHVATTPVETMRRDFLKAIRFGQGNQAVTIAFYGAVSSFYLEKSGRYPLTNAALFEAFDAEFIPDSFHLPGAHVDYAYIDGSREVPLTPEMVSEDFAAQIGVYRKALAGEEVSWHRRDLESWLCAELVDLDHRFQIKERRYRASDPHTSYFREYVLLQKATGSEAFHAIFGALSRYMQSEISPEVSARLDALIPAWEHNHPAMLFYPPEVGSSTLQVPLSNVVTV